MITYLAQFYHKFNKLTPQPALRRSLRGKTQDSVLSKDSGLEETQNMAAKTIAAKLIPEPQKTRKTFLSRKREVKD